MQSTAPAAGAAPAAVPLPEQYRARVTARLRECVPADHGVYELVAYHLGWRDASGTPCAARAGKMLRPSLLLAVAEGYGAGGAAVGAAAALELLHAFSLVHDDIEDGDRQRRHRPTLWALHGVPLALNAGDSLFALAQRTMIDAAATLSHERAVTAMRIFTDACLRMIEGQHDDLSYEAQASVSRDAYLRMTAGKTGALIGVSLALGALFGGAPDRDVDTCAAGGIDLGIAFQCVDDALGAWGDPARTGKAVGADAARGKKSLPAIIASEHRYDRAAVRREVAAIASAHAGAALAALRSTSIAPVAMRRLEDITAYILGREE